MLPHSNEIKRSMSDGEAKGKKAKLKEVKPMGNGERNGTSLIPICLFPTCF